MTNSRISAGEAAANGGADAESLLDVGNVGRTQVESHQCLTIGENCPSDLDIANPRRPHDFIVDRKNRSAEDMKPLRFRGGRLLIFGVPPFAGFPKFDPLVLRLQFVTFKAASRTFHTREINGIEPRRSNARKRHKSVGSGGCDKNPAWRTG